LLLLNEAISYQQSAITLHLVTKKYVKTFS